MKIIIKLIDPNKQISVGTWVLANPNPYPPKYKF